jgi:hypothetical protein
VHSENSPASTGVEVGTYYMVSGGPVRMTCHSKGLDSSTSPAENPLSVFLFNSARKEQGSRNIDVRSELIRSSNDEFDKRGEKSAIDEARNIPNDN